MPASKISIESAKSDKLFYFVANVMVYRESDGRCLILKRDERAAVHPGRWATPGGKLEWNDLDVAHPTRLNGDVLDFEDAIERLIKRETREEACIELKDGLTYVSNNVFVRPDGIPVVLMKFAAKYKSGEVVIEKGAIADHAWVNAEEVKNYPCIDGVREEIAKTIALFK